MVSSGHAGPWSCPSFRCNDGARLYGPVVSACTRYDGSPSCVAGSALVAATALQLQPHALSPLHVLLTFVSGMRWLYTVICDRCEMLCQQALLLLLLLLLSLVLLII